MKIGLLKFFICLNVRFNFTSKIYLLKLFSEDLGDSNFFIALITAYLISLLAFSNWLETWSQSASCLILSKQTFNALIQTLIQTLQSQPQLIKDLFEEGYDFIIPTRFQTDPLEKRYSQYRQMSGGNFLVSLQKVLQSERTLLFKPLLKESVNIWEEDISKSSFVPDRFIAELEKATCDIETLELISESAEVSFTIAGYIAKKLKKRLICTLCQLTNESTDVSYFNNLSRGGLTVPSTSLADLANKDFALLDFYNEFIQKQCFLPDRNGAIHVLLQYLPCSNFLCNEHSTSAMLSIIKIIVNCFL